MMRIILHVTCVCALIVFVIMIMHIRIGHPPMMYRPVDAVISASYKFALVCNIIRFNVKRATEILLYVHNECKRNEIPIILSEGTALGFVRDGVPIPWDDDIDLMIELKYKEKFMAQVFPNLNGYRITKEWNNGNFITLFNRSAPLNIDVEFVEQGIPCGCTINGCTNFPVAKMLDTVTVVDIDGHKVLSWGEEILRYVYGDSWQTPMHRFNRQSRVKGH